MTLDLEKSELFAAFLQLGMPEVNVDFFVKHFDANTSTNGILEIEEFEQAILHTLCTSIPGLSPGKMTALFGCNRGLSLRLFSATFLSNQL